MENLCSRPVILLVLSLIFGILSGNAVPNHSGLACVVIFINAILVIRGIFYEEKLFPSLAILFFAYGYVSLQPYVSPGFSPDHLIHYADKDKWIITGIVDERPIKDKDRLKFILHAETLGRNTPVTGKLRVTIAKDIPELSRGDRVSFVSKIRSIRNFNNPGGFDYERYMAFHKVWTTASVCGEGIELFEILDQRKRGRLETLRRDISQRIEETGPGKHVGILKALIIGDKSEISKEVREDFNQAGIAHLLAISGLHVGIIASLCFVFFRCLLGWFTVFLWEDWLDKGAALLSWFPVFGYGLLAGLSVSDSTQRAVIAVTVFLLARIVGKEPDALNTLEVAALLILATDPPSLFSKSFQLSFSAVFSIIYSLSKIYADHDGREKNQVREKLFSFFLVSLLAILGTLPFVMRYYNHVTLVGFFSNFVFIPLIGFVVVPLGLLSVILQVISHELASACIHISAFVLANTIETVTPTLFEICCFYLSGWAALNIVKLQPKPSDEKALHTKQDMPDEQDRIPRRTLTMGIIGLIALLCVGDVFHWLHERFWHEELRVTIIDVGQGTSSLVELPDGSCFLIDGGGFGGDSDFDVGERVLAPFLLHKRIRTLDKIILSHPDSDHLGGLLYIADHFRVREVWSNNEGADSVNYLKFEEIINKRQIRMPGFGKIIGEHEHNGVRVEVLYPSADFMEKKNADRWRRKANNNSLVIRFSLGSVSFLFPGDIEARAEAELIAMAGDRLKSTVLVAPHHGSRTSSSEMFIDAVDPEYVIISAGWNNRFHHPHPSVMKRYEQRGCKTYRTDQNGAISISTERGQAPVITPHISGP